MAKNFLENEQEAKILAPSLTFTGQKRIRTRDIPRIKGTCLYLFDYRSKLASDRTPLVMMVGRGGARPHFRYPPPATRAKGDVYLAAINLSYLDPSVRRYLITKYGRLDYIPTGEAHRFNLLGISYRIYDVRKIRSLYPVDVESYLGML